MEGVDFIKYISALVFVIALIGTLAWLARRFLLGNPGIRQLQAEKKLHILETKSLDPKRRLVVLDWDGQEYLIVLGANSEHILPKHVSFAQELADPQKIDNQGQEHAEA